MDHPTILQFIDEVATRLPENVAVRMHSEDTEVNWTYGQLMSLVKNLSAELKRIGLKEGDRIAIWARLEPSWVVACLASLNCGCVVLPLDIEYSSDEVAFILNDTCCKLVFAHPEKIAQLESMESRTQRVLMPLKDCVHCPDAEQSTKDYQESPAPQLLANDVAMIFYTSGTTGNPKGVVIQHQSIITSVLGVQQYVQLSPSDKVVALVPAHHVLAAVANIFIPLVAGASITYLSSITSVELLKVLQRDSITVLPAVPRIFYLFHRKIFDEVKRKSLPSRILFRVLLNTSYAVRRSTGLNFGKWLFARVHKAFGGSLRILVSAASAFDRVVIRDLYGLGFTVLQGYALTETVGGGTFTPIYDNAMGSVGKPLPGLKLKIIDPDESGIGEVAISGPSVMQGYYRDPEGTAEVLKDDWFHTGDLGRKDAQDNYYIVGRKKDMIVLNSGKKLLPEEVENHYSQSQYVKEICVLGLNSVSDYAGSERLHAVIVPDFDILKEQRVVNSKDIIRTEVERLSLGLPGYKRILSYDIRSEPLPRTSNQKVRRWLVQKEIADSSRSKDLTTVPGPVQADGLTDEAKQVVDLIRTEFHIADELRPNTNIELDLGFDSLQRIELVTRIEQMLAIRFSSEAASQFLTIKELLEAVNQSVSGAKNTNKASSNQAGSLWKQILSTSSGDDPAERYVLKPSRVANDVSFVLLKLVFVLAKLLFRLELRGLENTPLKGPYLICSNHQSYLDGILISSILPYRIVRNLFSVGYGPYFDSPIKRLIAGLTRIVPIDPDSNLIRAMRVSAVGLRAGKILLIFPEGTRTYDGNLQTFKNGAAILATELQVAVLPVAIEGSYGVWSKVSSRIRLAPVRITIGRPFKLNTPERAGNGREDYSHGTRRIREEINNLMTRTDGHGEPAKSPHKPE